MEAVELDVSYKDPTKTGHSLLQTLTYSLTSQILPLRAVWLLGLSRFKCTICNDLSQMYIPLAVHNADISWNPKRQISPHVKRISRKS